MRSLVIAMALSATVLAAGEAPRIRSGVARGRVPDAKGADLVQTLDAQVPLEAPFVDERGRPTTLGAALGGRPGILVLGYYACPRVCGVLLTTLTRTLDEITDLSCGRDYELTMVSIAPETHQDAAARKAQVLEGFRAGGKGEGVHFLTGEPASIKAVADAVGFRYAYDEASRQYVHPIGLTVLTPQGRTSRYFYGVEYRARDLRLALVEASRGRIGSLADRVVLICSGFDENTGRYTYVVVGVLRLAGVLTVLALVAGLAWMQRRARTPREEVAR